MRCPKCHYLSFEPEPRCKNCGYDFFALTDGDLVIKAADSSGDAPELDLPLATPRASAPMTLGLIDPPASRPAPAPRPVPVEMPAPAVAASSSRPADRDDPVLSSSRSPFAGAARSAALSIASADEPIKTAPVPVPPPLPRPAKAGRAPTTTTELPLFVRGVPQSAADPDAPIVPMPAAPRPPLAVRRRATEGQSGPNGTAADVPLPATDDLDVPLKVPGSENSLFAAPTPPVWSSLGEAHAPEPGASLASAGEPVTAGLRTLAAVLDALLLGGIDAGVLWLTLRFCSLTFAQAASLPILPLVGFFALVDAGYLMLFTATSGQTLGKMAARIRVIGSAADGSTQAALTLRQALVRATATLPSVGALGLGFLPALSRSGLAVHDRIAHTRVVRE